MDMELNVMKLKATISRGNMKLHYLNISLPPCASCAPDLPCYSRCYAHKSFRMYNNVRNAWNGNLDLYKTNPAQYFQEISDRLSKARNSKYFRWHVAGDIPDRDYLTGMIKLAKSHQETNFLAFTKRHDLDYSSLPPNLKIVASMWPSWGNPKIARPKAWMQDGTETRIPEGALICPGECNSCNACWHMGLNDNVIFNEH